MAPEQTKVVPLTCHGHSRPITHLSFSAVTDDDQYYLITACKDNNPILRDGITGDWIGTFIGHKGAVWSARLSSDAKLAATGSADFSAKIWDTQTGENLYTLKHNHIVRAVAFPPGPSPRIVATGGLEKKLRIWDIPPATAMDYIPPTTTSTSSATAIPSSITSSTTIPNGNQANGQMPNTSPLNPSTPVIQTKTIESSDPTCYEVGAGIHTDTIKSILFTPDNPNIVITASEDKKVRWWDLNTRTLIADFIVEEKIGSCELTTAPLPSVQVNSASAAGQSNPLRPGAIMMPATPAPSPPSYGQQRPLMPPSSFSSLASPQHPILSVAANKTIYFFSGSALHPAKLLKKYKFDQDMSCVALAPPSSSLFDGQSGGHEGQVSGMTQRQFVTGSAKDTWVHLFPYSAHSSSSSSSSSSGALNDATRSGGNVFTNANGAALSRVASETASSTAKAGPVELEIGKGHHGPVWSAAFSPDGRLYGTGSEDGTVKLWKVGGSATRGYGLWK